MVEREQLSRLAKAVMNESVSAQFLGLFVVASYLDMAFEEIVRIVAELNTETGAAEVEGPPVPNGVL